MLSTRENNIIILLSKKYKFNKEEAIEIIDNNFKIIIPLEESPINSLLKLIKSQYYKEYKNNIWKDSKFYKLPHLQSNNIGIIGEQFIKIICDSSEINNKINGVKTKKIGGGLGDGIINNKTIEIKTSLKGIHRSFQHELGETPWKSDYLLFIDISPEHIYLTIIKNFNEVEYKNCVKCIPYFPTRSFCWRKKSGAFKFDTTEKLNEISINNGYTIKIKNKTLFNEIGLFINKYII